MIPEVILRECLEFINSDFHYGNMVYCMLDSFPSKGVSLQILWVWLSMSIKLIANDGVFCTSQVSQYLGNKIELIGI